MARLGTEIFAVDGGTKVIEMIATLSNWVLLNNIISLSAIARCDLFTQHARLGTEQIIKFPFYPSLNTLEKREFPARTLKM